MNQQDGTPPGILDARSMASSRENRWVGLGQHMAVTASEVQRIGHQFLWATDLTIRPRCPVRVPRAGVAIRSLQGVTRFWWGIVLEGHGRIYPEPSPSACVFKARFIASKPCWVAFPIILSTSPTRVPEKFSCWTNSTRLSPIGLIWNYLFFGSFVRETLAEPMSKCRAWWPSAYRYHRK